ncbi:RBBP9/YdeN family alpha/beta hydrolase [Agromyces sp. MMS24-JH15]|uniref:RBBP9/YdeN family alpha/beta hydrolase n=1 Tax=Agromyces sp. MMS24-JH15 TaxID=3243765 RepID=UPI003749AA57
MARVVIVPGINGSGEGHWQTEWERRIPGAVRIAPGDWDAPELDDWLRAIDATEPDDDTVFVAHSMGCLAVATWLAERRGTAAGAFLVAPPDPDGPGFPAEARGFAAADGPLGVATLVVASTDDPYGSARWAADVARLWGAGFTSVGALGHVNIASGVGAWDDGADLFEEFTAGLACARVPAA